MSPSASSPLATNEDEERRSEKTVTSRRCRLKSQRREVGFGQDLACVTWYRSLYWRIAVGFISCLALLLVVQGMLFVWMMSRAGPDRPESAARAIRPGHCHRRLTGARSRSGNMTSNGMSARRYADSQPFFVAAHRRTRASKSARDSPTVESRGTGAARVLRSDRPGTACRGGPFGRGGPFRFGQRGRRAGRARGAPDVRSQWAHSARRAIAAGAGPSRRRRQRAVPARSQTPGGR